MDKLAYKAVLIGACVENRQQMADNAKEAMNEIQQQANEYGPPKDRYDAFRSQLLRKRDLFAEQYQKALDDIKLLERIDPKRLCEKVEFGALIFTNMQNLFVANGMGKIQLEQDSFFVISPQVPVFKLMEGKKAGESYTLNGKTIRIEDVF